MSITIRKIQSFVLRTGRISQRQKLALDHLPELALPKTDQIWDLDHIFPRAAPTILEIGFGMGQSLLTMAKERSDLNFIGVEVHLAGIGSLLADLIDQKISNVRVAAFDVIEVLTHHIADAALSGVQIFFPDPWPKSRHHKRRLIQSEFIRLLVAKIKPGAFVHCATDWEPYAAQILAVLSNEPELKNKNPCGGYSPRPLDRPKTKFEQRALGLGHDIWDLIFTH